MFINTRKSSFVKELSNYQDIHIIYNQRHKLPDQQQNIDFSV